MNYDQASGPFWNQRLFLPRPIGRCIMSQGSKHTHTHTHTHTQTHTHKPTFLLCSYTSSSWERVCACVYACVCLCECVCMHACVNAFAIVCENVHLLMIGWWCESASSQNAPPLPTHPHKNTHNHTYTHTHTLAHTNLQWPVASCGCHLQGALQAAAH
jgi:hypothetical protein